jgi:hypothetical protein
MGFVLSATSTESFDYHREESPAVSWNGIFIYDSRMMSMGGISMVASNSFSAAFNPAFIQRRDKYSFGVSGAKIAHEAFQFWGINQGVYASNEPLKNTDYLFSGVSVTYNLKGMRFAAGWNVANLLQLPSFDFVNEYNYGQYDSYSGTFWGKENTFYLAAAFPMGKKIDAGIKLDYILGKRQLEVVDLAHYYYFIDNDYHMREVIIEQREEHKLSALVPTVGARFHVSSGLCLSAAFAYPLKGKAKRTIYRGFTNRADNVFINSTTNSSDDYYRPPKMNLGVVYTLEDRGKKTSKKRLILAAETNYLFWSAYKFDFFDEEIPRDLKNTLVIALGLEYGFLSSRRDIFFRLGFRLDPQPVPDPGVTFKVLTCGAGIRLGMIAWDLGFSYFSGSPAGIDQNHYVLNSTINIILKGEK